MINLCSVQDLKDLKNIKNTKYTTFPYIMYKINDSIMETLKIDEKTYEKYKDFSYVENASTKYLVFKYLYDVNYISKALFKNNNIISYDTIEDLLSFEQQKMINAVKVDNIIFVQNL